MDNASLGNSPIDIEALEKINEKAIKNQFFVPDRLYADLGLFKDFNLGAIYAKTLVTDRNEKEFLRIADEVEKIAVKYQKRTFETVVPHLDPIGYRDADIASIMEDVDLHKFIFLLAPNTRFLRTLAKHIIRNVNHSKPAEKFKKVPIGNKKIALVADGISLRINTFPLTLPENILKDVGELIGSTLGIDVMFMNKDPALFDETDWSEWLSKIDCFYHDSLGRALRSQTVLDHQGSFDFAGVYRFARKRFETPARGLPSAETVSSGIQECTAILGLQCDFEWLQNIELALVDDPDTISMDNQHLSESAENK